MPSKSSKGREGENRAAEALEKKGMQIIARNFRSRTGEIDIIAQENETIVFVEVKTWTHYGFEDLRLGIDEKKQRRIIETAKYFLLEHRKYNGMGIRFDVVFISPTNIVHLASAFMERV
ncbi:YraN family protein [Treponema primitia]|uniref:YraN family protein n=1 Tax=Treponema primitia TaxID=88058 RepID=UPI00025555A8|nr:YraN family protein [Treponema primitia]